MLLWPGLSRKYRPFEYSVAGCQVQRQWREWLNGARGAPEWMWPIIGMASSLRMTIDLHGRNIMRQDDGTLVA